MTGDETPFSTRDDPHAQARAARGQPLLLHSVRLFREILVEIYRAHDIHTVVEIGVESGMASELHLELGASAVHGLDPHPDVEVRGRFAATDGLHLVEKSSPEALPDLPIADLYVVDGDHNYSVVHREFSWILSHAPDAVVVAHDVMWPSARRDQYYEPSPLASDDRHDPTTDGPTVWHDGTTPAGFVGLGAFTAAQEAGGERNGVLTAIEDALSSADDGWEFEIIPAVFGLGVLFRPTGTPRESLRRALQVYSHSHLLAALENNRIALYTRVLQLQYEAAAHAENADAMAEIIRSQAAEIAALNATVDSQREQAADSTGQVPLGSPAALDTQTATPQEARGHTRLFVALLARLRAASRHR